MIQVGSYFQAMQWQAEPLFSSASLPSSKKQLSQETDLLKEQEDLLLLCPCWEEQLLPLPSLELLAVAVAPAPAAA